MEYICVRSKRKTVSISINPSGEVIVRAPVRLSGNEIDKFVKKNIEWINKQRNKQQRYLDVYPELTNEQTAVFKETAQTYLPLRTAYFAEIMELFPNSVKITSAKKRFGSCSANNNICFSYMLMRYPQRAIDYVIVHELSHIKYKNHSKEFYKTVESILPDYKDRRKLFSP